MSGLKCLTLLFSWNLGSGMNVRLRYFVRVTITRSYNTVVKEADFAVQNFAQVSLIVASQFTIFRPSTASISG